MAPPQRLSVGNLVLGGLRGLGQRDRGWLCLGRADRNTCLSVYFDFPAWAWFVSVGAIGTKAAAVGIQYVVFRTIVRRRLA
jgi:hypothetical protein